MTPPDLQRDGAAYNVSSRSWRSVAPAPYPPSAGSTAVIGSTVYLAAPQGFWSYHRPSNVWRTRPPAPNRQGQLVAAGRRLVLLQRSHKGGRISPDHVYDQQTRTWSPLPRDPLAPAFDRAMVWNGEHLVLLGVPLPPPGNGKNSPPTVVSAAVLELADRTWTRVPQTDQLLGFGSDYAWTGTRIVAPYVYDFTDGGRNPSGARQPTGGYLDLRSGKWTRLPQPPVRGDAVLTAVSRDWITASEGLVLDVARGRWLRLLRAPGQAAEGMTGVWAGDQLFAFGGGSSASRSLTSDAWVWRAVS